MAGEVGLSSFDRDAGTVEIGWWTAPAHRGLGVASVAAGLVVGWAGEELGFASVIARCDADNPASVVGGAPSRCYGPRLTLSGSREARTAGRKRHLAERERRSTPPYGGVFVARSQVMDADDVRRAIWRMAHEIIEHNHGLENLVLVGLQTGGVGMAEAFAEALAEIDGTNPPLGTLDVALYRDDIGIRPVLPEAVTDIPVDLDGAIVVLVDDVLFTGRTIRAALDALNAYGRPRSVQLAVMVDRGHRELPIRPDYVGKNLPTRRDEMVNVSPEGVDLGEVVKS